MVNFAARYKLNPRNIFKILTITSKGMWQNILLLNYWFVCNFTLRLTTRSTFQKLVDSIKVPCQFPIIEVHTHASPILYLLCIDRSRLWPTKKLAEKELFWNSNRQNYPKMCISILTHTHQQKSEGQWLGAVQKWRHFFMWTVISQKVMKSDSRGDHVDVPYSKG